jgi:Plasmid pRiA4b ORF-3-like protein
MIWTLRIECVHGRYQEDEWVRVVEMDSQSSFFDIHDLIQKTIKFDRDHPFEFFAGRNPRHRAPIFDDIDESEDDFGSHEDLTLERVFPLPKNLKLYYHFDFGDDWYFEIRRMRGNPKPPKLGIKYPRVVKSVGRNPRQYG